MRARVAILCLLILSSIANVCLLLGRSKTTTPAPSSGPSTTSSGRVSSPATKQLAQTRADQSLLYGMTTSELETRLQDDEIRFLAVRAGSASELWAAEARSPETETQMRAYFDKFF